MDVDAYVAARSGHWHRLEQLVQRAARPSRLTGDEVDELVDLYQRTATDLSVVQSSGPDPALVTQLSSLVARARGSVAGTRRADLGVVVRFFTRDFPATVYRTRWWWLGATLFFFLVAVPLAIWIAKDPQAYGAIGTPAELRDYAENDFQDYYSSGPAADFAFHVWTNNAWIALASAVSGVLLGLPVPYLLLVNAANLGAAAGIMAANDRFGLFLGLILPHGLLELTAIFVASGLALRLGWAVVDPGRRTRSQALAEEGRVLVGASLGLVVVLFVSGILEAFVTPSPLPTWARVGIGVLAEVGFLAYVFVVGGKAHRAGVSGDLEVTERGDVLPTA